MGVYAVVNAEDGRAYVGSSVNIGRRAYHHLIGLDSNRSLTRDVGRLGPDAFAVVLIERVEDEGMLPEREAAWQSALAASGTTLYNRFPGTAARMTAAGRARRSEQMRRRAF